MKRKHHTGFTLLEMMMAIAILAVLAGFAVPGLVGFVASSRMSAAANDVVTDFNYARSESVKRGVPVTLCKSQDGAACDDDDADPFNRWIVFVDDDDPAVVSGDDGNGEIDGGEAILRDRGLPATITVTTPANQIRATFQPSGFPRVETQFVNRFVLCDSRGNVTASGGDSAARAVTITATGRPMVLRTRATITSFGGCP